MHTRINPESPPMSWKFLLSGYVPDYLYLYELGRIDTAKPFADVQKLCRVPPPRSMQPEKKTAGQRIK